MASQIQNSNTVESVSFPSYPMLTGDGSVFYQPTPASLKDLALASLTWEGLSDFSDLPYHVQERICDDEPSNYSFEERCGECFVVSDDFSIKEFTLDWFYDIYYPRVNKITISHYITDYNIRFNTVDIPCSKNWFLYLKSHDFMIEKVCDQNIDKLPWYQPDLGFLLMLSGDVESNPGPQFNQQWSLEVSLRKKVEALERARQRQEEKVKTLKRILRRQRKEARYVFQMNREEVSKLIQNPNVQRAAMYAATNFVMPGVGTAAASVIEGGKVLDATNKVRTAAESLADTCSRQIPELLTTHMNLADIASSTLMNINNLTTRLSSDSGLLGSLNNLISKTTTSISAIPLLISIILCLAAMAWDWKIGCAIIFIVLVYFNWPSNVIDKVRQLVNKTGWSWQMNVGDHIPIIGQIVFTLLAFFGVSQIPTEKFYDNLLKRMDAVPKAFSGMNKIWEHAGRMFDIVSDEFKIYFLGAQRDDLLMEKGMTDEVNKWVQRVKYYLDAKQKNLLARDEASVKEVEELFNTMYRWKHTPHLWKALSPDCQRVIASVTPLVQDLFKFACRSTVHEGGPRKAPLAVFISGDSGRGKSELLYPLAFSLLAHRGYNMENARNEIYVRNYETEYWDGYVGQKIAFFDDAFQMRDSPGNPSPEFMEAIRLINTAPAHVHCADLNDKGRFFSSEICIYTTNLHEKFDSYITSINCPEAAMRRLNANAYRIKTNPDFEKEITINGKTERRLDVTKIQNCADCETIRVNKGLVQKLRFCPHVQRFDKYDIISDEILQANMSYVDLVKQLKEYDTNLVTDEDSKLFMYDTLISDPYIFEMNEEEIFADCSDSFSEGAIDFASATDTVAYNTLLAFCTFLSQNLNIHDTDLIESEISAHNNLWCTYRRLRDHGYKNRHIRDNSLQESINAAGIHYNSNAQMYHSTRNLQYNFKNIYNGFCDYVKKIGDQLVWIWQNSGIGEILAFVYMGLIFFSLSAVAYRCFSNYCCPVCKLDDCDCIRVTDQGYVHKGILYAWETDDTQFEARDYSSVRPPQPRVKLETKDYTGPANARKMTVESDVRVSGQPKTVQFKVESDSRVSGQPLTKQFKVESDTRLSGSPQTRAMKVENAPILEMYVDQGCEMLENKLIANNLYLLHDATKPLGNVLFLRGTVFLMNYHYIELLKLRLTSKSVLYMSNRSGRLIELTFGDILDNYVRLQKDGKDIDAVLVYLDSVGAKCSVHTNIVKHFILTADLANLTGKYRGQLPSFNSRVDDVCISKRSLADISMSCNKVVIDDEHVKMEINHSWQYDGSTTSGDCGAPVILNHNSAIRKIVGIHMASNGYYGMAQTITQESIIAGLTRIPSKYQAYVEIDLPCEPIVTADSVCGSVPLNAGLMIHGKTDVPLSSGNNSKITPSKFFDYVPHKTIPAKLRATIEVDPMYIGLKKYGKEVPRIDPKLIEVSVNDVKNNFNVNERRKDLSKYCRVLTYEEALMGVPDDEFLAPINRSTSMGYPYTMKTKLRGKRDAFGDDEWDLNSDLARQIKTDVEKLIENCLQGIQTGVYWSDTLKDERRPIEKVQAGKTRVFCGGPVHFTIAFRKYFLGFAAWMMHSRNANEVSVGTNVFSPDWNDIVRKLASRAATAKGMNIVAGDFSNFDGSLSSQILWAILDAINEWYDDGEENAQIRRTLWMHIVHAIHINHDVIYQATHSQPSGCPITAILNSIYNSIIIRIAYLICAQQYFESSGVDYRSMYYFNAFVAMVSYGDDNLIGINEKILEWFNQLSITVALSIIGHEYTDEAKTGIIVPFRNIEEVAYLKRAFKWNPALNRYVAPLDLDTVLEIVQWTKRGLLSDAITLANLDVTMRELSLHDPHVFDKYKKILMNECRKNNVEYRFATQYEYLADVCSEPLMLEMNKSYVLQLTDKRLPKNYIYQDRVHRTLSVNTFDHDTLKNKLALFCHYRNITIVRIIGLPETLV
nr:MAG: RNA-dependent RNA polymerase [Wufeng shrew dicistrovirus 12]